MASIFCTAHVRIQHSRLSPYFNSMRWTLELDSGRWTLNAGIWMLDSGRWTMDAGLWTLDSGRWPLDAGC